MNKTAIKNFAVWARRKLIQDITYRARLLGVTEAGFLQPLPQSTPDLQFFDIGTRDYTEIAGNEIRQREALLAAIRDKQRSADYQTAFRSIVEEVAYTWFNRLIAIRFMEINDYLPSHIRVLSSANPDKLEPDMVTRPFDTGLEFSPYERDVVFQLKEENKLDELFRMLFIRQCNALHGILPELFEQVSDYSELLLTISFTDKDGVLYHLTHDISEDDFNVEKGGQVEIIGWLYQYYNTEPKDEVFALLKKNVKITKERIPAATQLFTPDWIVRYMVENSLGRLWVEGHPNESLKANWKYYLEEAEQEASVQAQLEQIREEYAELSPEDIKVIDPCMGSGHILVYAFEVLMQIYSAQGYLQKEAAKLILEKNLYGIDIDKRAYQLAYFAVMMKARQYNRTIFREHIRPNLIYIQNPGRITADSLKWFGDKRQLAMRLLDAFRDAEEYGSILKLDVTQKELDDLQQGLIQMEDGSEDANLLVQNEIYECLNVFVPLLRQARILTQKYDVTVTNPPYMGSSGMGSKLQSYVSNYYPKTKADLSTVFMEKTLSMCSKLGFMAMINIPVWMFLVSFEEQRNEIIRVNSFSSLLHFGRGIFGADFGTVAFVIKKSRCKNYIAPYLRLFEKSSSVDSLETKERWFLERKGIYYIQQESFERITGTPIAYWISHNMLKAFDDYKSLGEVSDPRQGLITGDNDRFLREWYEVGEAKLNQKWFVYNKGGEFRKWYGNNDLVVNWEDNGREITTLINPATGRLKSRPQNTKYYFREGFTWTTLSIGAFSARYMPEGQIFDAKGSSCFANTPEKVKCLLGLANSCVSSEFFKFLSPTVDYSAGSIAKLPVSPLCFSNTKVLDIINDCIKLSKADWDSFETSWDFMMHPLLPVYKDTPDDSFQLEGFYHLWEEQCEKRFNQLKANEEELNRIFIDIYGLQDELTPEVEDKDVTVRKADLSRDIRSLISYAVGCMFGRYSAGGPVGLIYAGGEWDPQCYGGFKPDEDNCIPVTDEEYFQDDIVGRFVEFIRYVYGKATLEENLEFIASALGNKGKTARDTIRQYFLNDFYNDHLKIYGKRPIYWMFSSGKNNGFKALVYMHRWSADTVGNLRVEYLHKMQKIYDKEMETCQDTIENGLNNKEIALASRRKEKLLKQQKECQEYDTKIAHIALSRIDIDLDDGVKKNYRKVQTASDGTFCEVLANSKDIMAKE